MNSIYPLVLLFFCLLLPGGLRALDLPPAPASWDVSCSSNTFSAVANSAFGPPTSDAYAVRWGAIKAGRGTIGVLGLETVDGRPAYHLFMEIGTTGMTSSVHKYLERTDAWIDKESLLTLRETKQTREKGYSRDEVVVFDQACSRYERSEHRPDTGANEKRQGRLPPNTLDMLGYLYYLRALPLAAGGHYDLTLLSGDHFWPVTVNVVRRTKISGPSGWNDTFFLKPALRPGGPETKLRQIEVWFSADEQKVPVRLRMELNFGSITAERLSP